MKNKEVSFHSILSWFGRWTPQFRSYLAHIQKQSEAEEFQSFCAQSIAVFRQVLFRLSQIPSGSERAMAAHQLVEGELVAVDRSQTSCKKGCSACCHNPKQVTSDEADLLVKEVVKMTDEHSRKAVQKIYDGKENGPCAFLSEQGHCQVYHARPAVCRKLYVSSPVENCETGSGDVNVELFLMPELITSAAMSLPDQKVGLMKQMLVEKLERIVDDEPMTGDVSAEITHQSLPSFSEEKAL